jgi:translation initiation factor IF-3
VLLQKLLAELDRNSQCIVQVAERTVDNTDAVCRIVDKVRVREAEKQRTKSARATAKAGKRLELNWAIDPHDLEHRLERLQDFLGKGMRVEITVAPKRKGRKATLAEAVALMEQIRDAAGKVDGAKEMREPAGRVLGPMVMVFEGKGSAGGSSPTVP